MVRSVAFLPGDRLLVTAGDDGTARIWDVASHKQIAALAHGDSVSAVTASPRGRLLIAGTLDGRIAVWDAGTARQRTEFQAHSGRVATLTVSPDGRRLFSVGDDRGVRYWPATEASPEHLLAEGKWWLGVYQPVARWLSLDEDRPGALWSWTSPEAPRTKSNTIGK
jgi:WD40 repeat protein